MQEAENQGNYANKSRKENHPPMCSSELRLQLTVVLTWLVQIIASSSPWPWLTWQGLEVLHSLKQCCYLLKGKGQRWTLMSLSQMQLVLGLECSLRKWFSQDLESPENSCMGHWEVKKTLQREYHFIPTAELQGPRFRLLTGAFRLLHLGVESLPSYDGALWHTCNAFCKGLADILQQTNCKEMSVGYQLYFWTPQGQRHLFLWFLSSKTSLFSLPSSFVPSFLRSLLPSPSFFPSSLPSS